MKLITHSLLSSWLYLLKDEWGEDPMQEFMLVLNREPTPTSEAMQNGIEFENLVTDILNDGRGVPYDFEQSRPHPWLHAAEQVAERCRGGVLQYTASKKINVGDEDILLYGRLDCLKAGEIIDIKFSKKYERGKYFNSTQHPVYMELVPEAKSFSYTVSNGAEVWEETYRRDETGSIYPVIADFINWLKNMGLYDIYAQKWETKK